MAFATLGNCLKIFQLDNGKFSEVLTYSSDYADLDAGKTLSWSGDGQWIIGPVEKGGALPIFKFKNGSELTRVRCLRDADACSAVFLNYTNRLLAVGSKAGLVTVWNVKDKKLHQVLGSVGEGVKFLQVCADDMYIAAATPFSPVKIYGLTTNRLVNTLIPEQPAELSDLKFSLIKKNYLAYSSLQGSVVTWDIYKSTIIMNRENAHIGGCSGIAMSPTNNYVVASVGMNGSLIIHDAREKALALTDDLGTSPRSIEWVKNEPCALIGSHRGQLLTYDLRAKEIISEQPVHGDAITSIKAVHIANTKPYENVALNTPESDSTMQPHEVSLADICTPVSTVSARIKEEATSNLIEVSPITSQTTSTPNQPLLDSFCQLFGSALSPAPVTIPRLTNSYLQRPSPLASVFSPQLNGISEENEEKPAPAAAAAAHVTQELIESFRDIVQKEVSGFEQRIHERIMQAEKNSLDQIRESEQRLLAQIQLNREVMFKAIRELEHLRIVVRLEQVYEKIAGDEDF